MEVELPNGQIGEFPDDMPHEQIQTILQKQFSPKLDESGRQKAFHQVKGNYPNLPDFLVNMFLDNAEKPEDINHGTGRGGGAGAFVRSAIRTPLEGAENLASLFGLPVNKNAQWPGLIAESEADKSYPLSQLAGGLAGFALPGAGSVAALRSFPLWRQIAEKSSGTFLKRAPVMGAEGALLGAGFSPEGHRSEGAVAGAGLGIAGASIPSVGKGLMNLKERFSSLRNLDKLRSEGKITNAEYKTAIEDESALVSLAKKEGLSGDSDVMQAEFPDLVRESQKLSDNISKIPEVNTKNMLPRPSGENIIPEAESLLNTHENQLLKAEKDLSEHIYKGYSNDVPIAESVVNEIEGIKSPGSNKRTGGIKQEIGKEYDAIEAGLENENIIVPRNDSLKQIEEQARKSLENSMRFFKNDAEYESTVKKIVDEMTPKSGSVDIIPASDVLSNYRSLNNMSQKLRKKAYSREVAGNKDLQSDILGKAEEMQVTANQLSELLEKHDLGTQLDNLKLANSRWKNEIVPLYKNSSYQTFLNKGYSPSKDLIYSLRGNGPGQEIIRNIIKKNPELIRRILGQRYAGKEKNIHDFDQLSSEFIEAAPQETRDIINRHLSAHNNIKSSRKGVEEAGLKSEKMKSESQKTKESFNEEKANQKNRSDMVEKKKALQDKIAKYERYITELKKKTNAKNMSLKEKIEIESKIKEAEKDRKTLIKQGIGVAGTGLSALAYNIYGGKRSRY